MENKNIYLSIIVLVYNTEMYFNNCLDSILSSLEKSDLKDKSEIIVINDGSKGNITDLIVSYLNKNSDIKFIDKKNTGRGDSRNLGISKALGKYIHFIDSDDYIDESLYKDVQSIILNADKENHNKENDTDLIVFDIEAITKKGKKSIVYGKNKDIKDIKEGILNEKILASSCNKIIKKTLFDNLKYPIHIKYEDLVTIPIVVMNAKNIVYLNKSYYKYIFSDNSAMRSKFSVDNFNLIEAIELLFNNIDDLEGINDNIREDYKYQIFILRIYEDIFEQIMLVKDTLEKAGYIKLLCSKLENINYIFDSKIFLNMLSKQSFIKRKCNEDFIKCIKKHKYKKIKFYLNKKMFYRLIFVNYFLK